MQNIFVISIKDKGRSFKVTFKTFHEINSLRDTNRVYDHPVYKFKLNFYGRMSIAILFSKSSETNN